MVTSRTGLFQRIAQVAAGLILCVLVGCQSMEPPVAPTQASYPPALPTQPVVAESYPNPGDAGNLDLPIETYPAPEEEGPVGPGQAPARPNGSRVTAKLIEAAPYEQNPAYTRLRVRLISSQALEGMASVTDELVDQEIELLVETAQLPDLQPGETFEAEVSWMGDEHGSNYYIRNLLKTTD